MRKYWWNLLTFMGGYDRFVIEKYWLNGYIKTEEKRKLKMKNQNKQKGITLVALVITIIILLILAGITISSLTDSGLFGKAKEAKEKHEKAQNREEWLLQDYEEVIDSTGQVAMDDLEIIITNVGTANIREKVEVKNNYENAAYIYWLDDKMIAYAQNSTIIIGEGKVTLLMTDGTEQEIGVLNQTLESGTQHKITVETVLADGTIHKSSKKFIVGNEEQEEKSRASNKSINDDLKIITIGVGGKSLIEKIQVDGNYENAVYTYLFNNKIIANVKDNVINLGKRVDNETIVDNNGNSESDTEAEIILVEEELQKNTEYQITVVVSEENGKIHKTTKKFVAGIGTDEVFAKMESEGKTEADLSEYGISYTYSGGYDSLYSTLHSLGIAAWNGISSPVYSLTIDYDVLTSKMGKSDYQGFSASIYQEGTRASYVSTEMVVKYEDGTQDSVVTPTIGWRSSAECYATVIYQRNKNIDSIKINLNGYNGDGGGSYAYITALDLLL